MTTRKASGSLGPRARELSSEGARSDVPRVKHATPTRRLQGCASRARWRAPGRAPESRRALPPAATPALPPARRLLAGPSTGPARPATTRGGGQRRSPWGAGRAVSALHGAYQAAGARGAAGGLRLA